MNETLIGCGLYTIGQAARILHVRPLNLQRWTDGRTYTLPPLDTPARRPPCSMQSRMALPEVPVRRLPPIREKAQKYRSEAIVQRELRRMWGMRIFTFTEVVELHFVNWCYGQGISLHLIRAISKEAMKYFRAEHPFALQDFAADGYHVFALFKDKPPADDALSARELPGLQLVFANMVEPRFFRAFFDNLDYGEGWVSRWWPMGRDGRVIIDPQRAFGKPIDDETGVRTDILYRSSLSGDTVEEVADWYDVPIEAVVKAKQYEESLGVA